MRIGIQTWGSEGDIRPFLALAGGLSAEGHDVTLAVTGVKKMDFNSDSKRLNFKLLDLGYVEYEDNELLQIGTKMLRERNPLKQIQTAMSQFFYPLTDEMMDASKQLCDENELLIRHFIVYPLGIAAELKNRPCVSVFTTPPPIPSKYTSPFESINLGSWFNAAVWKVADRIFNRLFGNSVDCLRKREGLESIRSVMKQSWASDVLNLIAISPTLLKPQPDWEDSVQICGFLNVPQQQEAWQMPGDLTQFIDTGSPPVYMTFGSMMEADPDPGEILKLKIDAALSAGCRAIIQSRWEAVKGIPEHPDIYRISRAPHKHVFPRCAAVVHAGGTGTVQSATFAGCPSVVVAHASDQTRWAIILQKAGVAPDALHRRSLTKVKLAKSIRTVLDSPQMKRRAEELSARMQKENGIKKAIESIHMRFKG